MTILKRTGNNDVGTPTKVGGNDWDELYDFLNGVNLSGKSADIGTTSNFQSGKISLGGYADLTKITAPGSPASGLIRLFPDNADNKLKAKKSDGTLVDLETAGGGGGDVTGAANVGTGVGNIFRDEVAGVLNVKRLQAGSNVTLTNNTDEIIVASTGGGGSGLTLENVWYMYIDVNDANKVKATNGVTNYSHASDAGNVLESIFGNVGGSTVPFVINVAPGNYLIKSWEGSIFGHSNFTIQGSGIGVTNFVITDELEDVDGNNSMFNFQGPSSNTAVNLAADAPINSFAVMTNSATGLTAGDHVLLGSSAIIPMGGSETGEHNRIVKVVATGGSPSHRIILEKYTRFDYNTADTAYIRPKPFLENICLRDFTLKSDTSLAGWSHQNAFMRFDYAFGITVENIHFKDWGNFTGNFHHCLVTNLVVDSIFNNIIFEQSPERGHAPASNASGYAISCRAGCETLYFTNCRFIGHIRHNFSTTSNNEGDKVGHPMNIWMINCNSETTDENHFDSHGEGEFINYVNCSVHSSNSSGGTDSAAGNEDTDAFGNRCNYVRYINCTVANNRGLAYSIGDGTHGHLISNCSVKNIEKGSDAVKLSGDDIQVNGLFIDNVDNTAIQIEAGAKNIILNNIRTSNTNRDASTNAPINIEGGAKNITLSNCIIDTTNNAATSPPIKVSSDCEGIIISQTQCVGGTKPCDIQGLDMRVDHTTCRGGGLNRPLYEKGEFLGNHSFGNGLWVSAVLSDTGGTRRIESTDGMFREYVVSAIGTIEGFRTSVHCERDLNPYLRFRFRSEQTTGLRLFMGWNSDDTALGPAGGDPLANKSGFMIKLDTTVDSNIKIYHNDGGAVSATGATIAALDNNAHIIELRANNGASGFQWRWDEGAWSSVITVDVPAATQDLGVQFYIENQEDTVNKTLNMMGAYTELRNF